MNKLVTICIPTDHRLPFLKEAVASALAQTYSEIEVLISQDPRETGPDESIRLWCLELAKQNPKVKYQCHSNCLRMAGNWNACAEVAAGDYLVIIGDDDRLLPSFVEKMMGASEGASVVFANHFFINEKGRVLKKETKYYSQLSYRSRLPPGLVRGPDACIWSNGVPMSASLIRTDEVRRLRFKEDLNTPEIELFLRLAQEGGTFVFVPEYLAEYRSHADSETEKGLALERLIPYLIEIPASAEAEPFKRRFLGECFLAAVGACLLKGRFEEARAYSKNDYYASDPRQSVKRTVQKACLALPPAIGIWLYHFAKEKHCCW